MRLQTLMLGAALLSSTASAQQLKPSGQLKEATAFFTEVSESAGVCMTPGCNPTNNGNTQASGAFAGDFDRDGWVDLFVLGHDIVADRLFMNNGDGTFTEEATAWGVDAKHIGEGGAIGDYDGDGWLDIFVTSLGSGVAAIDSHRLYRNNGDRTFSEVAVQAGVNSTGSVTPAGKGACFGDYDLDGDLDLFVACWQWAPPSKGNRLFRNNGDGTFTNVTGPAKISTQNFGFSPIFADMDGDRYPELLVASDFRTSKYYVNNRDGTFTDQTGPSGTGLDTNGMGATVADFDNDGDLDWYVTSIFFPTLGTGNMLYINQGNHVYTEQAEAAHVHDGNWGWGTESVDWDHDGWVDLIETNGWTNFPTATKIWRNLGGGTFSRMKKSGLNFTNMGRGMLSFDYDRDGDRDIVVTGTNISDVKLFRNELDTQRNRWLQIFFDTSATPDLAPDGFGTRVKLTAGGETYYRYLDGGSRYGSISELSVHFGLGSSKRIDEIQVQWANGTTSYLTNVRTNRVLTVKSPKPAK